MHFYKYESIGNDFVLIDVLPEDPVAFAVAVCDRKFGVGSDGLLVVERIGESAIMRMFNPDGTEDFCGNGLRCAGLHLWDGTTPATLTLVHGGQNIQISFGKGGWIDVTLPAADFSPERVPLALGQHEIFEQDVQLNGQTFRISSLTTGSTHTVISCQDRPEDELFLTSSPQLETDARFPKRTSVIWSWPKDEKQTEIRIWERGVGETLGCGTGSAAVAAVEFRKHPGLMALGVKNPGGDTVVARGANGSLVVSARAKLVYEADLSQEMLERINGVFATRAH